MNTRLRVLLLTVLFAFTGNVNAASDDVRSAAGSLEEVIVSATYRDTKLIDTPISISALTEDDLQNKGIFDLQDLYTSLPSVSYRSNSQSYNTVTIRGLTAPAGGGSTVGMYVDNIPVTDTAAGGISQIGGMSLDLARVEALKGPQGTLYGEGAMGGAIRYITNDADPNTWDIVVNGTLEQNSESEDPSSNLSAIVNIPLIKDVLGVRIGAFRRDQAGFFDIEPPRNEKDVNWVEEDGGRIKINWFATDWLNVEATYNYQNSKHGGPGLAHYAYGSGLFTDPAFINGGGDRSEQANISFEMDLRNIAVTTSLSYFKRNTNHAEQTSPRFAEGVQRAGNCVAASQGLIQPAIPPASMFACAFFTPPAQHAYPIDAVVTSVGGSRAFRRAEERGVLEIRALSTNEDSRWQWVAGLYAKQGFGLTGTNSPLPGFDFPIRPAFDATVRSVLNGIFAPTGAVENQIDLDELAVYGELTYQITDQWDATLGLRGSKTTKRLGTTEAVLDQSETSDNLISPKLTLSWRPVDGTLVYATVAQGFRPGFFNQGLLTHNIDLQADLDDGPPDLLVSVAVDPGADENGDGVVDRTDAELHLANTNPLIRQEGDEIISYEFGLKTQLFDDRMTLIGAAFYSDWKDTYLGIVDRNIRSTTGGGGELRYTLSAGAAHTMGLEFDVVFAATDTLTLSLGGDYTPEAEMDIVPPNTAGAFSNAGVPIPVLPGNRLPNSPEYSLNINAAYQVRLPWNMDGVVHADYFRVPFSYANVTNEITTPGYHQFNLRLTAHTPDREWRFSLFVKNLTNEVIKFEDNEAGIRFGKPRTIGAEFTWTLPE